MTATGLHTDALALLRRWTSPDDAQETARQAFVRHLEEHEDGLERGCSPAHVTASTLVFSADRSSVLLTLHAKANAWFQVGGHCEPDDGTLAGAAAREAREETGIADLALDPVPVQLDAHQVPFCHPRGPVRHLDVRFLAVAPAGAVSARSAESLDVRWWPVEALPTRERSLLELVARARRRLH